ncbi:thioredoxin domain-containing protein [Acidobacterium sp. S8]|uniref:DsbA family protein n=1 Tax=Acidobacterium sp. S8 TaxID=1641854 RepID=UPI0020B12D0E|nr:thioredoxin domain-containing protein [Acidobacterium sp. S8]
MSRAFFAWMGAAALIVSAAHGQSGLKPPPGAKVAMIEFSDLECPSCAHENPVLKDAAAKYHIPWERHDFPIQYHRWSTQAAVNARWFDTKSEKLGGDYRDAVFANQASIETPDDLRNFTDKFAKDHGMAMPFAVDPQGKLAAEVKADYDLGIRLGVHQTPTVWVVTDKHGVTNATQVSDFNKLYSMLDEAVEETGGNTKQARK